MVIGSLLIVETGIKQDATSKFAGRKQAGL